MSLRGPVRCRRSVFLAAAHEPAATDLDQDGADVDASEYAGVQGSGSARPGLSSICFDANQAGVY
jgi:hypothetical protein